MKYAVSKQSKRPRGRTLFFFLRHNNTFLTRRTKNNRFLRVILVTVIASIGFWQFYYHWSYFDQYQEFLLERSSALQTDGWCDDYGCPIYPADIVTDRRINHSSPIQTSSTTTSIPFASLTAAALTRKGNDHHPNQDRAFIIEPFVTRQTPNTTTTTTTSFLVAVFDGHGIAGHLVAHDLQTALPRKVAEKLNSKPCCQTDDWIQKQLKDTFIELDQEGSPNFLRGGATASVTLRIGSKLYFANCGDSLTILFSDYQKMAHDSTAIPTIRYQTRRDKPHIPEERERILQMGGSIHTPPLNPAQSRVIVYSVASLPYEPIGLAMSRSIGDWEWKLYGVIAEPIVDVVTIGKGQELFLIAASDGVWDMRPRPDFFAREIGKQLAIMDANGVADATILQTQPSSLWEACVDILWKVAPAKEQWYRDDMTLMVMSIR
jgi:serine/threonine protein phosphatase PrpC